MISERIAKSIFGLLLIRAINSRKCQAVTSAHSIVNLYVRYYLIRSRRVSSNAAFVPRWIKLGIAFSN